MRSTKEGANSHSSAAAVPAAPVQCEGTRTIEQEGTILQELATLQERAPEAVLLENLAARDIGVERLEEPLHR